MSECATEILRAGLESPQGSTMGGGSMPGRALQTHGKPVTAQEEDKERRGNSSQPDDWSTQPVPSPVWRNFAGTHHSISISPASRDWHLGAQHLPEELLIQADRSECHQPVPEHLAALAGATRSGSDSPMQSPCRVFV